jgi:hypothetical protein
VLRVDINNTGMVKALALPTPVHRVLDPSGRRRIQADRAIRRLVLCEPAIRVAGLIAREQVDQIERLIDQDRVDEALNLGTQQLAAAALERSDGALGVPLAIAFSSPFRCRD